MKVGVIFSCWTKIHFSRKRIVCVPLHFTNRDIFVRVMMSFTKKKNDEWPLHTHKKAYIRAQPLSEMKSSSILYFFMIKAVTGIHKYFFPDPYFRSADPYILIQILSELFCGLWIIFFTNNRYRYCTFIKWSSFLLNRYSISRKNCLSKTVRIRIRNYESGRPFNYGSPDPQHRIEDL